MLPSKNMSRLVYSALGRQLPSSEWLRVHGDTVMKVLYDLRTSPFNPQNDPLPRADLHHVTGLSPANLELVLAALVSSGFVEKATDAAFRITDEGFEFVASSPAMITGVGPFGTGSLG